MDPRVQSHRSDPRILGRRTLDRDHGWLAKLLRPGLTVLDVGCGTGAITAGIANAVGPLGNVVGLDRDPGLLEIARQEHAAIPNLRFEAGDATDMSFQAPFDIVTAARTLQWISQPERAVLRMHEATRSGGLLVVLDYNHAANAWEPEPPAGFRRFYAAFLAWREANHWDNRIADHLPELFRSAGLRQIESHVQDEVAQRGEPRFDEQAALWSEVIENLGEQVAAGGRFRQADLRQSLDRYRTWAKTELRKQTLSLRTVVGRRS